MAIRLLAGLSGDSNGAVAIAAEAPVPYAEIVLIGLVVLLIAAVVLLVAMVRRRLVRGASIALKQLDDLNALSRPLVAALPPIKLSFAAQANSKSKYDRFNLLALMSECVLERQSLIDHEVAVRLSALAHFRSYHHDYEAIAYRSLGKSNHPRVGDKRFVLIEQKLFDRAKLAYPTPAAKVITKVSYTSPKGQNSYARDLVWDFDQLRQGLNAAVEARAAQSTSEALRRRERSLMTSGLRMKILRRDNFRCQMCGASASDGASLHVDHITPVSLGGQTSNENLQALCQSCNLGKSNHFVG